MDHDASYHLLFSHPELVVDLFKNFVEEKWIDQLDFKTLVRVNAKFHGEGLERRDGDLIYQISFGDGSQIYLYLLLEFQSRTDKWMALRVSTYVNLLYQHLVREDRLTPNGKLPPVFPLVIYNGDARWTAPSALKDLIDLPTRTPLWAFQPAFRYHLLDESRYPEGKLGSMTGALFRLENCQDRSNISAFVGELNEVTRHASASLRRAILVWLTHVLAPGKGIELTLEDVNNFSEVQVMLATRVKQWEREILDQGIEKGIQRGEAELLCRILTLKFGALPAKVRQAIDQASRTEIEEWGLKILSATTLDEMFH